MSELAILILRVALGAMFMAHGAQKALGVFGGGGIQKFSEFLGSIGFAPAIFWAYLAAYTELIGGLCVLIGLLTRTASALLFILIMVAAAKLHIAKGFFLQAGGFEYTFIIAAVCLALMLSGPGKFSLFRKF